MSVDVVLNMVTQQALKCAKICKWLDLAVPLMHIVNKIRFVLLSHTDKHDPKAVIMLMIYSTECER